MVALTVSRLTRLQPDFTKSCIRARDKSSAAMAKTLSSRSPVYLSSMAMMSF